MIRRMGRIKGNVVELLEPGGLQEGALVEVEIHLMGDREEWHAAGMHRLEEAWDNPEDAIYDDWKRLYGVQEG
jgi:hypothetical protein